MQFTEKLFMMICVLPALPANSWKFGDLGVLGNLGNLGKLGKLDLAPSVVWGFQFRYLSEQVR